MKPVQPLLDHFRPRSEAESTWINSIFTFISQHLSPPTADPAPSPEPRPLTDVQRLAVCAVQSIQERLSAAHSLPVSYRPLSVSELVSQQHLACVSNLSWSTNQHRVWAREAELPVPGLKALPRVNLLLIGCLKEGRDGQWRLTDNSGSVQCELLSPSPLWLGRPVFLPHWNYVPRPASDQEEAGGCLELIGPPIVLHPRPEQGLADGPRGWAGLGGAVGVREALGMFQNRVKGQRVSVCGRVGTLCPLLAVSGTTFFCFTLTDSALSLPVLVKDGGLLSWFPCLAVGLGVCVTALRVCVLRGWRGNNILCATERSELHTDCTDSQQRTHASTPGDALTESRSDTPLLMTSQDTAGAFEEAEPHCDVVQSGARMKPSKVINYQGTVTEVISEGAGLYVIDGKVGLCLAYQPTARRKLRAGDRVEVHHAHFLYRPCPDLPPSMLCACLRSSVRVTAFSGVGGASPSPSRCPQDGALPRLLLQTNRGVSDYLWACHLSSRLVHSLVPAMLKPQQCVCLLSWMLMETLRGQQGQRRRDIYSEMLDEPHTCPLTQYSVDASVHQYLSVSELHLSLQSDCWSSLSLGSLLPPDGPSLNKSQINSALSWSCRTLSSDPRTGDSLRERPLLLVGVLQLSSPTSELQPALQLSDGTGTVSCVVTETSAEDEGGQRASDNTAWIGCLVCVQRFTMVTERFLQSEFPSYQHLDQEKFITHKHCRIYLQFSFDHVHILSPSVAMGTHLRQREAESAGDVTARKETTEEEQEDEEEDEEGSREKRRRADGPAPSSVAMTTVPAGGGPRPCVSVVIRIEQKQGVAWSNTGAEPQEGEKRAELSLSFSVRATLIGPVVIWGRDPRNEPMTDREAEREMEKKVLLVFSGASARWFPLLQPGRFYRVVAVNGQDPSVLIGSEVFGRKGVELHTDSSLQVSSGWRFHSVTRPLTTCAQRLRPPVLSVAEVQDCGSELVCFQGLVSERISVCDRTNKTSHANTGVRLTVCDQTGRSLQVYLDLSHAPYPPGLLPGNTLLLSAFRRRLSRTGSVYCASLPVSSITVLSLADSSAACRPPPPPIMHLGHWSLSRKQWCSVGRVKGHVVCVLLLQLQWSCSLCGCVYTQGCRSSQCRSTSAVFQSKAKVVVDDGTGEAHVWFSGALVRSLLGLAEPQWEGLQRALRVKGHLRIYPQGRSLVSDSGSDDALLHFLLCVCSSDVMSRPVGLTCRQQSSQRSEDMKRFSRADRDFMTRLLRPLQLTCLSLDLD